jgi:type II secretory pathway pseudopilin PulG
MKYVSLRSGVTYLETLIFIALFGAIAAVTLPMFFTSAESRIRQQAIAHVEQNGVQVLQTLKRRIQHAERILVPARGQTGSLLVLQTGSGATHPTIVLVDTGSIILIERDRAQRISSLQLTVSSFVVRNTSASDTRPSAHISFRASRIIRLVAPQTYERMFESLISLFPDDTPTAGGCTCLPPRCSSGRWEWYICTVGVCTLTTSANLPPAIGISCS